MSTDNDPGMDKIRMDVFHHLATSDTLNVSNEFMEMAENWAAGYLGWDELTAQNESAEEEEAENLITFDLPEETLEKLREVAVKLHNYGNSSSSYFYYN